MNAQEDLALASLWVKTLPEEAQKLLRSLSLQLTEALDREIEPTIVLQKLGQEIQKGLGSVREYLNKETIEKTLHENLLCIVFRLHSCVTSLSRWERLDSFLFLADRFFHFFALFVNHTVHKKPHPSFSQEETYDLCKNLASFFLSLAFPERESSFLIPLPSLLQGMAMPYAKRVYDELEKKGASLLQHVLEASSLRASLFFQVASFLHKTLCHWKGEVPPFASGKEKELEVRREKLESILERAVFCLTLKGEQIASLCPKYQLSSVGIVLLDRMNDALETKSVSLLLQTLQYLLHLPLAKEESSPSFMLERLEKQFLHKNSYAPLFYQLARKHKGVPSFSRGPFFLQVLFQGFLGGILEQSFESLPWDEFFSLLDFALRRSWYYSLSNEIVLWLKESFPPSPFHTRS